MKPTKNQDGFTLIEVLIAAVIITFGMLAMNAFLGNYMTRNNTNTFRTDSAIFAQEKMEELRTLALQTTLTTAGNTNLTGEALDHNGNVIGVAGTAGVIYTRFWRVDDTKDPKQIDVLVSWDGTTTSEKNVSFSTLVNNDAP